MAEYDIRDDPAFRDWERRVKADLIPKLRESAFTMSLVPDETDVKFAVELGMSIMLDKPIIALVAPGAKVPERLVRVADHIIEADLDTEAGKASLAKRLNEIMEAMTE